MSNAPNWEFDFTLILDGFTSETEQAEDCLFEAGCDDATLAFRSGRPVLTFSRTATTLLEAVQTAIRDVLKAGIDATVVRVDDCNLEERMVPSTKKEWKKEWCHPRMALPLGA